MFRDTVTSFHYDNGTWYPFVLSEAELQKKHGSHMKKEGTVAGDSCKLFVHFEEGYLVNGVQYLPPKQWKPGKLTFLDGKDFFCMGDFGTDPVKDENYSEGFAEYMFKTYDDVYRIQQVDTYHVIPHFEILGE